MATATHSQHGTPAQSPKHEPARKRCRNVSARERWASALLGAGLIALGTRRRFLPGTSLGMTGWGLIYRGITGHCGVYNMLGITKTSSVASARGVRAQHGFKHEESTVINRPPEELFTFWRRLENLPRIMEHLESVTQRDEKHSHWVALGPFDKRIEWDAEINNERPNELIAWRSMPGSQLDTAGSVHFERAPGDRGTTIVRVSLKYDPPGGKAAATLADLFGGGFEDGVRQGLRRFKQVAEAGEIPRITGQPQGHCR